MEGFENILEVDNQKSVPTPGLIQHYLLVQIRTTYAICGSHVLSIWAANNLSFVINYFIVVTLYLMILSKEIFYRKKSLRPAGLFKRHLWPASKVVLRSPALLVPSLIWLTTL